MAFGGRRPLLQLWIQVILPLKKIKIKLEGLPSSNPENVQVQIPTKDPVNLKVDFLHCVSALQLLRIYHSLHSKKQIHVDIYKNNIKKLKKKKKKMQGLKVSLLVSTGW